MADAGLQAASDLLWDHWQRGGRIASIPAAVRPATREAGYAVQALLERRSAFPLFGWKIAATSQAGQAHIAVDGPLAGRLLRERVRDSGGRVPFSHNRMRVAEAEFAFRMAADLRPRDTAYQVTEVLAAVATLHPAIEVPDSRFEDFTAVGAALIADNAWPTTSKLGPAAPANWRSIDLEQHRVSGCVNDRPPRGSRRERAGRSPRRASSGWSMNCRA